MDAAVNAYKFIEKLGNQSKRKFAEVQLMREKSSGKKVIFKMVYKTEQNKLQQERLRSEATFSLHEKGFAETLDFIENDIYLLLIKEHLEGKPLDEYWETLPSRQRNVFVLNFIEALIPLFQTLRAKNIVHCDIKPSNLLVKKIDGSLHVGLIDFGMAIRMDNNEKRKTLFPLGYAAPELILNRLDLIDHRTDLFSLGIVIWRLFVGALPLTHPNPSIMTNLQITHPLPDASDLPKELIKYLQKMSFKHVFRDNPNNLSETELKDALANGMNARYNNLEEFYTDLVIALKPKKWFGLI